MAFLPATLFAFSPASFSPATLFNFSAGVLAETLHPASSFSCSFVMSKSRADSQSGVGQAGGASMISRSRTESAGLAAQSIGGYNGSGTRQDSAGLAALSTPVFAGFAGRSESLVPTASLTGTVLLQSAASDNRIIAGTADGAGFFIQAAADILASAVSSNSAYYPTAALQDLADLTMTATPVFAGTAFGQDLIVPAVAADGYAVWPSTTLNSQVIAAMADGAGSAIQTVAESVTIADNLDSLYHATAAVLTSTALADSSTVFRAGQADLSDTAQAQAQTGGFGLVLSTGADSVQIQTDAGATGLWSAAGSQVAHLADQSSIQNSTAAAASTDGMVAFPSASGATMLSVHAADMANSAASAFPSMRVQTSGFDTLSLRGVSQSLAASVQISDNASVAAAAVSFFGEPLTLAEAAAVAALTDGSVFLAALQKEHSYLNEYKDYSFSNRIVLTVLDTQAIADTFSAHRYQPAHRADAVIAGSTVYGAYASAAEYIDSAYIAGIGNSQSALFAERHDQVAFIDSLLPGWYCQMLETAVIGTQFRADWLDLRRLSALARGAFVLNKITAATMNRDHLWLTLNRMQ